MLILIWSVKNGFLRCVSGKISPNTIPTTELLLFHAPLVIQSTIV